MESGYFLKFDAQIAANGFVGVYVSMVRAFDVRWGTYI